VVGITKKTVSVRLPYTLYDKLSNDRNTNTYVVTKALQQYYRSKEPNQKVFTDCNTNVYDRDLIDSLKDQIDFLKGQVTFLQKQNSDLSCGWFGRVKLLLESKK